jgi:preprotein translocase subunit Sec61beta
LHKLNIISFLKKFGICVTLINASSTLKRQGYLVSSRRKKKESGPMPAASAGLLRFFEEETEGVKIRPELLVIFAISLMVLSVLAKVFFAG